MRPLDLQIRRLLPVSCTAVEQFTRERAAVHTGPEGIGGLCMCGPKRLVPFASLLLAVAAFGAGCIGSPRSDVPLGRPQIASQPANVSVTVTTTATFSV